MVEPAVVLDKHTPVNVLLTTLETTVRSIVCHYTLNALGDLLSKACKINRINKHRPMTSLERHGKLDCMNIHSYISYGKLWNNVPQNIRSITDFDKSTFVLDTHLFDNY